MDEPASSSKNKERCRRAAQCASPVTGGKGEDLAIHGRIWIGGNAVGGFINMLCEWRVRAPRAVAADGAGLCCNANRLLSKILDSASLHVCYISAVLVLAMRGSDRYTRSSM